MKMNIKTQCESLVIGLAMMVATMSIMAVYQGDKSALVGQALVFWVLMMVNRARVLSLFNIRLVDELQKLRELRIILVIAVLVISILGVAMALLGVAAT